MQNEKKCCAEIIKEAIEKRGNELQTVVCMEECSKMLRGKGSEERLEICIADVMKCVEVLEEKYDVEVQVTEEIDYKLRRLKKRIEEDEK